ncbi:glycoside hydrolase superfamily [Dactylonectria estremocensis]|uniref:Glycoside hydrolase superfamily n=1 Tax=Dactylonectria estremocensis TaxID=1079267 RepID=A0A9P9IIT3_9HYPO|nr:glycoside hydrolase superfamily [Dactylonectria estremocensis]
MKFYQLAALGCLLSGSLAAVTPAKRDAAGTATVFLDEPSGKPEKLASGFIYGLPDNVDGTANTDIPQKYFKDMGFNYCRAGGAQAPAKGWALNQYEGRWKSALSNYRTTRRHGGKFILLIHDLWGADGTQGAGFPYPGDKGSWKKWNQFLDQVFEDIRENNMIPGLEIDIWNEPDLGLFWNAPQTQYLNLWKRTYERIRLNYLKYIARTNTIPDIYSWHLLNPERNVRESKEQFQSLLKKCKLPERPININEYAWVGNDEQSPAGAVFYISQLERHNAHGLHANWGSNGGLHDLMANVLVSGNGDYSPTGEWHVYSYYSKEMKGQRVATSPSDDELFEVYATRGGGAGSVKVLAAIRPVAGKKTYDLSISGLSALKIKGSTVRVRTKRFDGPTRETAISGPVDLGVFRHTIRNDQINFWVSADAVTSAFAFEFEI